VRVNVPEQERPGDDRDGWKHRNAEEAQAVRQVEQAAGTWARWGCPRLGGGRRGHGGQG
jgi:hypothetical protein